jgi:hypothetical protein
MRQVEPSTKAGHKVMPKDAPGEMLLNGYYVRLPSFAQDVGNVLQ